MSKSYFSLRDPKRISSKGHYKLNLKDRANDNLIFI